MPEFFSKIVGVTFGNPDGTCRQEMIEDLEDQLRTDGLASLVLQRDKENLFDGNAVQVLDLKGRQLGFLSRQVSQSISSLLDNGVMVQCEVAQITGQDLKHHFGINIKLSY